MYARSRRALTSFLQSRHIACTAIASFCRGPAAAQFKSCMRWQRGPKPNWSGREGQSKGVENHYMRRRPVTENYLWPGRTGQLRTYDTELGCTERQLLQTPPKNGEVTFQVFPIDMQNTVARKVVERFWWFFSGNSRAWSKKEMIRLWWSDSSVNEKKHIRCYYSQFTSYDADLTKLNSTVELSWVSSAAVGVVNWPLEDGNDTLQFAMHFNMFPRNFMQG